MAIACIGACTLAPSACPKYLPPAFNPNPCWLLDLVFPTLQGPESEKWDRVRVLLKYGSGCADVFKPVKVEVEGQDPHGPETKSLSDWQTVTHGALPMPCGTRLLTAPMSPNRLIIAAGQIKQAVEAEERLRGPFRAEGPITHAEALDRLIEIARCAAEHLGKPRELVVVYGW